MRAHAEKKMKKRANFPRRKSPFVGRAGGGGPRKRWRRPEKDCFEVTKMTKLRHEKQMTMNAARPCFQ